MRKRMKYTVAVDLVAASEGSMHTDRSKNSKKLIQRCFLKYGHAQKFQFNVKVRENYI